LLFDTPKTKMPLYYYTGVHALWMMNYNGGKRLTKKQRIGLKRRIREAKKLKAIDDAFIDRMEAQNSKES
jgi:hypothetical protein